MLTFWSRTAAILLVGSAMACARPRPAVVPEVPPPLEVPVVPPRVLAPVSVQQGEVVPAEERPESESPRVPRPRPRGERPADAATAGPTRSQQGSEVAADPKAAGEQGPQAPASPTRDDAEASKRIRDVLGRANAELQRLDLARLASDARTQFETARRFIDQAEDALKVRNYLFARYLADKAEALARGLQGR